MSALLFTSHGFVRKFVVFLLLIYMVLNLLLGFFVIAIYYISMYFIIKGTFIDLWDMPLWTWQLVQFPYFIIMTAVVVHSLGTKGPKTKRVHQTRITFLVAQFYYSLLMIVLFGCAVVQMYSSWDDHVLYKQVLIVGSVVFYLLAVTLHREILPCLAAWIL
mmetsp:Transcript_56117/g.122034  ORF Transcript_56117/g.122034 Transcript_56117/m.122034 type:complete len:161 (-) Transcript_56117:101-583(-)